MAIPHVGPVYETRYEATPPAVADTRDRRTWIANRAAWGAIIAGVVAALLVQLLLAVLGLGAGLASLPPGGQAGRIVAGLPLAVAVWWVASGVIASFVGGLVAGRLCGSARRSTAAWHGFVAWCVTTLLIVWLLAPALGGPLRAVQGALADLARPAGAGMTGSTDSAGPGTLEMQVRGLVNPNDAQAMQSAIVAYIRASVSGDGAAAAAGRQRAVESLARVANISLDEAQNRLNQLQAQYQLAAQRAREAAQAARRDATRAALLAFAALVVGGIASILGGAAGTPRAARGEPAV